MAPFGATVATRSCTWTPTQILLRVEGDSHGAERADHDGGLLS